MEIEMYNTIYTPVNSEPKVAGASRNFFFVGRIPIADGVLVEQPVPRPTRPQRAIPPP